MPASKQFRVAAVQAAPVFLDLEGAISKGISLIWIWLDSPAWGMRFVQRYFDNSLVLGGEQAKRLNQAAANNKIYVVMGYSERSGGSLYMGQSIINDKGETIFTRRKLKPTHVERTVFGEGDGSHLCVMDTEIGRVGAMCCWEHLQPLSKYAMYSQDEQIHIASWPSFSLYRGAAYALGPELNNAASQMYAAEGQCFVLAPCATVSKEMIEMLIDDPRKEPLLLEGGGFTMIYGPDGRPLAKPLPENEEGLLYADVDLGMISIAKAAADPAGHYCAGQSRRVYQPSARPNRIAERYGKVTNGGRTAKNGPARDDLK
jgi:aliphatic nitrilase